MEEIKRLFTDVFIEAIVKSSPQKLYPLCNNYRDMKKYGVESDFTKEKLGEIVLSNCSKFLDSINFDISKFTFESSTLNGAEDDLEIVKGHTVIFAKSFVFKFKNKISDEILRISVDNPIIIDDQIKINNPLLIEFNTYIPYVKPESITILDSDNFIHELPLANNDEIKTFLNKRKVLIEGCSLDMDWYIHEGDLELDDFNFKSHIIITGDLSIHEPLVNIVDTSLIVLGKTTVNALSILNEGNDVYLLGGVDFNIAIFIHSSGSQIELRNLFGPLVNIFSETVNIEGKNKVKSYNYPGLDQSDENIQQLLKEKYFSKNEDNEIELDDYAVMRDIKLGAEIFNNNDDQENFIGVILPNLKNRETIISLLKEDGLYLKNLEEKDRLDKELINIALDQNQEAFKYIPDSLKEDKDFILELINKNGDLLEFVNDTFKKDKELVLSAISSSAYALEYAHKSFKADKEIVLLAVSKNARSLEYASETLQADEDILLEVIKNDVWAFKYASPAIVNNRNVMLELIKKEPKYLSAPPLMKYLDDREFLIEALKENNSVFNYLTKKLQKNKEFRDIVGRV